MSAPGHWAAALAVAVRAGVEPERFWKLSVREWRAIAAPIGPTPLARAEFEFLMQNHPDM